MTLVCTVLQGFLWLMSSDSFLTIPKMWKILSNKHDKVAKTTEKSLINVICFISTPTANHNSQLLLSFLCVKRENKRVISSPVLAPWAFPHLELHFWFSWGRERIINYFYFAWAALSHITSGSFLKKKSMYGPRKTSISRKTLFYS